MKFSDHVRATPQAVFDTLKKKQDFLPIGECRRIYVVGSGSSYSQAIYLCQLLNNLTDYSVIYLNPYSFVRHTNFTEKDICIHFSQEAKRNDNLAPLNFAKRKGGRTILFTAKPENNLAENVDEVYWFASEPEKILVASTSYLSGYAAALNYVNAQLGFLGRPQIEVEMETILERMEVANKNDYAVSDDFTVFLCAGYSASIGVEGALKVNECYLKDAESYELKHYSHGKHFVSWNNPRLFNVLVGRGDLDLVNLYKSTIFEKQHIVNVMGSSLRPELAVFEWGMQMLNFIVRGMSFNSIELTDIPIRDKIRVPHTFEY